MDLLTPGTGLIIWQTFVFLLLVILLGRLAWKPILAGLKERETSIQSALDTAEKARQEIADMMANTVALLKEAREERDKMLREAREATNRMKDEARTDAKKAADKIIEDARHTIGIEKQAALREIRIQVAMFSLEIAGKLMKQNLSTDEAQKELVQRYVSDLKVN
jgi:F-type H+-transporting ATPase subunit b